jgi:hypothetical protein
MASASAVQCPKTPIKIYILGSVLKWKKWSVMKTPMFLCGGKSDMCVFDMHDRSLWLEIKTIIWHLKKTYNNILYLCNKNHMYMVIEMNIFGNTVVAKSSSRDSEIQILRLWNRLANCGTYPYN